MSSVTLWKDAMNRILETHQPVLPAKSVLPALDPGKDRRLSAQEDAKLCRVAIAIAAVFLDIDPEAIEKPNRSLAPVCEARHVAMYIAHVVFQVSLIRSGMAFGRDRTSIAHAVRRIEDRRDDPEFDARIGHLERLAHLVRSALLEDSARNWLA
ncbi:helix-turn-helix domain-containing protein [Fulvimarina pelagi]|uniref:ATPase involved in DNA replication initiation n=1 Tax=Fulvimarina pelagi TaxID=217511 RepID=A0A0P0ZB63_9HYPH|nr:helix-turn-helix domain-containing protein [Fulvimarina pelagi]BAT31198.1 ATPase involved in DNA replication initiation [Fulvimarina pelagi]